jgi:tetratricopeptide (TPR) repeat protein
MHWARSSTETLGLDHHITLGTMRNLALTYQEAGKLDLAVPLYEETLKLRKAKLGLAHPDARESMSDLAGAYQESGKLNLALPLYKDLLATARNVSPNDSPQLGGLLAKGGNLLLEAKAFAEAEPLLREGLAIREKTQPDGWSTFNAKSMLGGALVGQKKYVDAEPLLLAGYEGMKQREKAIPPLGKTRIPRAIDRLIDFYTATNKPDEVKKWRVERAKYPAVARPR